MPCTCPNYYCMDKHHSTLLCVPLTGLRDWPVQPSNTLLMKNSMKSRECALVWHQVWSQSLCLYHNPINPVQLVWWELTYLVQVNIPNIKSFDEEFNPDFLEPRHLLIPLTWEERLCHKMYLLELVDTDN